MAKKKPIITGTSGGGLFSQINDAGYLYYPKKFSKNYLEILMRVLSGSNTLHRRQALNKNRKNRWSKETREKYAAIAKKEWEDKQKQLILKNEV